MKNVLIKGKVLLFVIFFLVTISASHSQHNFERIYGGNGSDVSIKVIHSGSRYIMVGTTTSQGAGSYDVCLMMTDTFGNIINSSTVGAFAEDVAISSASTVHKEYLVAGYTNSFSTEHPFFMKFDQTGNFIWGKELSVSGWAEGVASDQKGNIYLTGYHSNVDLDVFVVKCDSSGSMIWQKSFGDSLLNEGRAIISSHDDGILVAGITHLQAGGPTDVFVLKVDSLGNLLWSNSYAVPSFYSWDLGYTIKEMGSDIVIGALSYSEAFNPNPNSADGLVIILDSAGNVKRGLAIGSADYEDIRDLFIDDLGRVCVTGVSNHSGHGNTDILLACFDTLGQNLTQKHFGGSSFDHGFSICAGSGSSYLISGYTESFGAGFEEMYLIKTDGNTLSCNATPGNISVVAIQILKNSVFDIKTISATVLPQTFSSLSVPLADLTMCNTTGITGLETPKFYVSPNPFNSYFEIHIPDHVAGIVSISLYDLAGRIILDMPEQEVGSSSHIKFDATKLSQGLYFLKIESENFREVVRLIHQ